MISYGQNGKTKGPARLVPRKKYRENNNNRSNKRHKNSQTGESLEVYRRNHYIIIK